MQNKDWTMKVSPSQWMDGWFVAMDTRIPGWRQAYDAEAIRIATVDVIGDDKPKELDLEALNALAEMFAKGDRWLIEFFQDLAGDRRFIDVGYRMDALFRIGLGSSLYHPELREARKDVVQEFLDLAILPLLKLLKRAQHAEEERDPYWHDKEPQNPNPEFAKDEATPEPMACAIAEEAARLVLAKLPPGIGDETFGALQEFFVNPWSRIASDVASRWGIAVSTLTRAVEQAKRMADEELGDADAPTKREFGKSFYQALISAA